jgi:hypothetical protein
MRSSNFSLHIRGKPHSPRREIHCFIATSLSWDRPRHALQRSPGWTGITRSSNFSPHIRELQLKAAKWNILVI